jgi:hypothetical protein
VFPDEIHRELDGIGENQVTCIDPAGLSVTLVERLWQGYGSLSQLNDFGAALSPTDARADCRRQFHLSWIGSTRGAS